MKLTINSFSLISKQLNNSNSGSTNPLSKQQKELQTMDGSRCINCNVFCFSNSVHQSPIAVNGCPGPKEISPNEQESKRKTILEHQKPQRKHKICLSIQQNQSKREQTPKKQQVHSSCQSRFFSQKKKEDALFQQQSSKKQNYIKRGFYLFKKFKTEPSQLQKLMKRSQLKESNKPSTGIVTPSIMSPVSLSLKQSKNSNSKKAKLSLSNGFKSSLNKANIEQTLKIDQSSSSAKYYQSIPVSQQVHIQQSFITAKLHNIYEQINDSFLQYSYSNIIQYNKLMANQQAWKHPGTSSRGQINPENVCIQATGKKHNPKTKKQLKNLNLLNDLERQAEQSQHMISEGKNDIRGKFMQRKYIGEYAKTIKTFNESDSKEDNQSIVLQQGLNFQGQFPGVVFNQVMMREDAKFLQRQDIKRQYSSFGELQQESSQIERNIFRQCVSHPIYQISCDQQKQN